MTTTALVTGASGFLAAQIIRILLARDYVVVAAVRSEAKAEACRKVYGTSANGDRLRFAIVPDMQQAGAYDEALKGVSVVFHTASPFHFDFEVSSTRRSARDGIPLTFFSMQDNEKDMLIPAREGVLSLLESAKKAKDLKTFIFTGSFAAITSPHLDPRPGVSIFSPSFRTERSLTRLLGAYTVDLYRKGLESDHVGGSRTEYRPPLRISSQQDIRRESALGGSQGRKAAFHRYGVRKSFTWYPRETLITFLTALYPLLYLVKLLNHSLRCPTSIHHVSCVFLTEEQKSDNMFVYYLSTGSAEALRRSGDACHASIRKGAYDES